MRTVHINQTCFTLPQAVLAAARIVDKNPNLEIRIETPVHEGLGFYSPYRTLCVWYSDAQVHLHAYSDASIWKTRFRKEGLLHPTREYQWDGTLQQLQTELGME